MWRHLTSSSPSDLQDPSVNSSLNGAQDVCCLNVRHRWMCSGHRPCSLIASSHFMPGCGTMIPSLGSPLSPTVGPHLLGISPLKRRWRMAIGSRMYSLDVANHDCRLSSRLKALQSPVEWRLWEFQHLVVVLFSKCRLAPVVGGLTFSLVVLTLLECIVLMLFGDSSLLPFCTLWTCEGQSCN